MEIQYKNTPQYFIALFFFLFPILSIIVQHWVSFTFLILVVGGVVFAFTKWQVLSSEEKNIFAGFIAFCGFVGLSLFYVDDVRDGFRYFEKYTSFLFVIFSYVLLKRLSFDFAKYFIAGCVVAPIVWLSYYYLTTTGVGFKWPYYAIFTGGFSVLVASFSIAYMLTLADSKLKKVVSLSVFLMATTLAILSAKRGVWLYYPALLIVLFIMFRKKMVLKQWLISLAVISVMLAGLLVSPPQNVTNRIGQSIKEFNKSHINKPTSVRVRLIMWKDSIKMFVESPFIGVGISDFKSHRRTLPRKWSLKPNAEFGHAHSIYFNLLATTGLLGFLGLIVFVFWLPLKFFCKIWKNTDSAELKFYSLSGIILITSFMVFGLTESWLSRNPFVRTYLIMMVLLMSSIMFELRKDKPDKVS